MMELKSAIQRRRKTLIGTFFFVLTAIFYLWTYTKGEYWSEYRYTNGSQLTKSNQNVTSSNVTTIRSRPRQRILLWTSFFGRNDYYFGLGSRPFSEHGCPITNCEITTDQDLLRSSNAVIFHFRDMNFSDVPTERRPSQRWIFYLLESPTYTTHLDQMKKLKDAFNWTMTYRLDSDIVAPYGRVIRKAITTKKETTRKVKRNLVAWLVSHCDTESKREDYVRELQKYIPVDIFGTCGRKCMFENCEQGIYDNYKFYLAFENTVCKDYVTEKFYKVLGKGIVPVVYGGANYSVVGPPNSFVDARTFETPRHLANYLIELDENKDLYEKYFKWEDEYEMLNEGPTRGFCDLCEKLNNDPNGEQIDIRKDLYDWWAIKGECVPGFHSIPVFTAS